MYLFVFIKYFYYYYSRVFSACSVCSVFFIGYTRQTDFLIMK